MADNLTEIVPGLYLIPAENNGRFPYSHSFLVEGTACAVIDTGCGAQPLEAVLREHAVGLVIASHSHPDHTARDWMFKDTPLYAPVYSADSFGDFERLSERFAEPGELASVWIDYVRTTMDFRTAPPTRTFADGHVFDFGRIRLVAVHTPGHTLDHTCFFEPQHGVLLSFDIDLTSFGPWYGHRESDIAAFQDSIRKVMALQPRVIVSSHKGIIADDIPGRLQRYLDVFEARDQILLDLLPSVHSMSELIQLSPFYQGYPYAEKLLRYWEGQMIHKHLARLSSRGHAFELSE